MSTDAATAATPPPSVNPPIVELLHFASSFLGIVATSSRRFISYAIRQPTWPVLAVAYRALSYLLAPLFLFIHVVLDVLILTPYALVKTLAENVYPVYVFLGASLICAACVGFAARLWVQAIRYTVFGPRPASHPPRPPAAVPKARKRVSIKEMKKEK